MLPPPDDVGRVDRADHAALVADVRQALLAAPQDGPAARFERITWLALLDTLGAALLTREQAPAHLTASGLVLSPDATRTCLVFHKKMQLWVQPGGHFEPGDATARDAAAREVLEECGLSGLVSPSPVLLSRHLAPCAPGVVDWHLDLQFVVVTEPTPPVPSDETPRVGWWPVNELPSGLADGVGNLVARTVAAISSG